MPGRIPSMPPYPDDLSPEAPLVRISLSSLLSKDPSTEAALFSACQSHGFFYLDLTTDPVGQTFLENSSQLQSLAHDAFHSIPQETKNSISFANTRSMFGYKPPGQVAAADPHKRKDVGEFLNISKDDIFQNCGCRNIPYPSLLTSQTPLFRSFMSTAHSLGLTILTLLASHLSIPPSALLNKHRINELSGDHVRMTWAPGSPSSVPITSLSEAELDITTPPHTDFGSVTFLFNWLGGLQIENAATKEWQWVRPLPGHAIVNLGDAMVEFSGGKVRSGKHRVVAAPGEQSRAERLSLVYFVRPEDEVFLEDLTAEVEEGQKSGQEEWKQAKTTGVRYAYVGGLQNQKERWKVKDWILERARNLGNSFDEKDRQKAAAS
ncbi:MAG: hypothetical protein M1820_001945 [Bogoriella megaspora]|nr:MAG: hypothetical protein M1820_001945 [Bogoriella megaspora]